MSDDTDNKNDSTLAGVGYSSIVVISVGIIITIICCRRRSKQQGRTVTTGIQSGQVAGPFPMQPPMPQPIMGQPIEAGMVNNTFPMPQPIMGQPIEAGTVNNTFPMPQPIMGQPIMGQPIEAGMVNNTFPMPQPYPGPYSPNMTPYPPAQMPYQPNAAPYPPNPAPYSSQPPSYLQVTSSVNNAPIPMPSAPLMEIVSDTTQGIWADACGGAIPPNAVVGGHDGENMYIGRAYHGNALIPGKVLPSHRCCYVPWGEREHAKSQYQVLCGYTAKWIRVKGADIPTTAIPGGISETGEPLYIGRFAHKGTLTVGKVQASHKVCYIAYGGREIANRKYEILVQ